ncbi:HU family DNA-binding protein [Haliangium ochraceum]|uniref:Histone family protein DNA-binding protein n=1 Tax=Haliangium ochraceum (strain DSM 14365 / JCM 11303 / SMP-2) TaxID=502025 RepID=D0LZC7_HALO1|nr:HU family DNA-binding protein [Haliangium ochraceum]ACY16389.1 histone family protein DNA-binding protein [Haliangium ochraceum DSM 14365]
MPTTKSDLIEQLSSAAKLPKAKAELVVSVMFECMAEALQHGERIEIRGFGSFEVRDYKAYEGRNPRTGEPVQVDAKRLPFFKIGKELRERINNGGAATDSAASDDA